MYSLNQITHSYYIIKEKLLHTDKHIIIIFKLIGSILAICKNDITTDTINNKPAFPMSRVTTELTTKRSTE